ncbi:hypothetical protein BKA62DRAFT_82981 [Auriculariales sp. MPI-PUGE-AT-0066]|nr:hypothetical protein BKA62DRAFT_82981 [Auriculariales sp. MPI-PUGE-AT-0066]
MNSAAHKSGTVNASPPTPLATQATYSVKSKSKSKAVAPSRRRKKSKTRFSLTGDKKKTKKKGAKRLGVDEQDKTWDAKQWDEYDWEILYIREVFKTFEGNLMYYVKWAGWEDDEEWRWQDAEYMDSCKELVSSFWDDLRAQAQKRFMTNVAFQRAMLCGKVLVPTAKWIRDQKSEYLEREPAPIPLEPGRRAISPGPWSELKPDFDPIQHVWKDAYNSTEGRARSADLIDSDTDSGDDFQDFQDFGQVESDDVQLTTRSPLVPRQLLPFGVAAPRSMLPSTSDIRFHTRPSAAIPPTPHSRGRPRFSVDEPTPSHGQYWTPDQYMRRILDRKVVAETHSWVGKEQVRLPNLPFFEGDRMQRSFGAMVLGPTSHISSDSVTALGHQAELTQHTDMSLNAQWQQPQRSHGRTFAVPEHQNASFTVSSDSGIDMDDDFFCPPEPFLNEHDNLNDAAGPIVSTDAGISQSGQEKRPDQLPKVQAAQPTSQAEPEPAVDPAPAAGSGWNTVSDSGITTTSAWGDPALTTTATGWGTEISGSNWQLAPTQRISQSDQGRLTTPPATHVNKCSDRQEKYSDQPPKVQVAQSTSQAEPEQAVNPASAAGSGWNSGTITTSGWGDPTCSTTAKGWGTEISGSNWQLAPILSYSGSSPTKSVDKLETTSWAKVDRAPRPQHLYLTTRSHNKTWWGRPNPTPWLVWGESSVYQSSHERLAPPGWRQTFHCSTVSKDRIRKRPQPSNSRFSSRQGRWAARTAWVDITGGASFCRRQGNREHYRG